MLTHRIGLLFTHNERLFRGDFCNGAKLHRADLLSGEWHIRERCSYYTGYIAFNGGSKLKAFRYSVNTSLRLEILFLTELQIEIIIKLLNIILVWWVLDSYKPALLLPWIRLRNGFKEEIKYNLSC